MICQNCQRELASHDEQDVRDCISARGLDGSDPLNLASKYALRITLYPKANKAMLDHRWIFDGENIDVAILKCVLATLPPIELSTGDGKFTRRNKKSPPVEDEE